MNHKLGHVRIHEVKELPSPFVKLNDCSISDFAAKLIFETHNEISSLLHNIDDYFRTVFIRNAITSC